MEKYWITAAGSNWYPLDYVNPNNPEDSMILSDPGGTFEYGLNAWKTYTIRRTHNRISIDVDGVRKWDAFHPLFHGGYLVFAAVQADATIDIDYLTITAIPDRDHDGLLDYHETDTRNYLSPTETGTDPDNPDTDGDGLLDGEEVATHGTNPNLADTDGDQFDDKFELSTGFDPTLDTSTPDTYSWIRTAVEFEFATVEGDSYRVEASTDLDGWNVIETDIAGNGGMIRRFYSTKGQPRMAFRARKN